jgi:hypothetical protein
MPTQSLTPAPNDTRSQKIFKAADPTTQKLIKALLNVERGVMHMKRRDEIHKNLGQIVKTQVTQA